AARHDARPKPAGETEGREVSELPVSEADLQAYADGRLTPERRAMVDAWLATHPEAAERVAAYQRLGQEVRAAYETMLSEPVPPRLAQAAAPRFAWQRAAAIVGWIALGIAIGAPAGWELRPERTIAQSAPD